MTIHCKHLFAVIIIVLSIVGCSSNHTNSNNITDQENSPKDPSSVDTQTLLSGYDIDEIDEYKLDNGLTLLVRVDRRSPVVISQIWYKIGSIYEPKSLSGISHMLEHMMFKGTKDFKPGTIEDIVQARGGQQNAVTSHDYTAYYQYWGKNNLAESFKIESSRMKDLLLDPELFQKERQVVMEERRMRIDDNPQSYAYETLMDVANHPNSVHQPVIGWMKNIQSYQLSDLKQWYQDYYAPNNATMVVVGDVKPEEVYQMAKKYFGDIPASKHIPDIPEYHSLLDSGYKSETVYRDNVKVPVLMMAYNTPSIISSHQNWEPYALIVLNSIIASNQSSRLRKELVRKQHIAIEINSHYNPFTIEPTLLMAYAVPDQNTSLEQLEQHILRQISDLKEAEITQAELARIKKIVVANKIYALDSIPEQADMIGTFASIGLPKETIKTYLDQIIKVTPEQVSAVANKYLNKNNLTVIKLKNTQQKPLTNAQTNNPQGK